MVEQKRLFEKYSSVLHLMQKKKTLPYHLQYLIGDITWPGRAAEDYSLGVFGNK